MTLSSMLMFSPEFNLERELYNTSVLFLVLFFLVTFIKT